MSKFATANCPYQTQPRTSVQLGFGQVDSCRYWLIGRLTVNLFSTLQYSFIVLTDVIYKFLFIVFLSEVSIHRASPVRGVQWPAIHRAGPRVYILS